MRFFFRRTRLPRTRWAASPGGKTGKPEDRPISAIAQHHEAEHPATVGIAIEAPVLRRAVCDTISEDKRYKALPFDIADVIEGTWPRGRYAGIVATPGSLNLHRRHDGGAGRRASCPVILVVREDALFRDRAALASCDAFVTAERVDSLLPSTIVLSTCRLSVVPASCRVGQRKFDRRLLMLPHLEERERAVLAELARGSDNGTIARRLAITESMAKVCVRRVVDRLGFRNRTDAAVFAARFDLGDQTTAPTPFAKADTK